MKQEPKLAATDNASRLSGIRGLPHDEDERPSREDADYGQTLFTRRPVPLPRWLGGGKRNKRSRSLRAEAVEDLIARGLEDR